MQEVSLNYNLKFFCGVSMGHQDSYFINKQL